MTDLRSEVAPGWFPDPSDPAHTRYWDGNQYTAEMHWDGAAWVECGPGWWRAVDGRLYPPDSHATVPGPVTTTSPSLPGLWLSPGNGSDSATQTEPIATPAPAVESPAESRRRPTRRTWVAVAVIGAVAIIAGGLTTLSGGGSSGWTDPSLHVVGSPVTVHGMVVVLDVRNHHLELTGVKAADGSIVWHQPFSASAITPGVGFGPTVLDDTVVGLAPAGTSDDPSVTVEGIDPPTGKVIWTVPQPLVATDAPAVCSGGAYFCIAGPDSATTTALALINPATGDIAGVDKGPYRNMAVPPPGTTNEGDLWQTGDSTPTFMQISPTGAQAWTKTVASVFGGSQFDPSDGWDFLIKDGLDVGSVGVTPTGNSEPLGGYKTLGISTTDGTVRWSDPGNYLCGGGLQFLTADVVCRYTGTAVVKGQSVTMSGVTLTLEGLNAGSGATTWSRPVLDPEALSLGTNVAFADGTHVVVRLPAGNRVVLDVQNGHTSPVGVSDVFWCEQNPMYKVTTPQGASAEGQRQSAPVFRACSADGSAVKALPTTSPSTVGVTAGSMFVWPTPKGLQAAPVHR